MKIKLTKIHAVIGIVPILIILALSIFYFPQNVTVSPTATQTPTKNLKFDELSTHGNVFCFGPNRIYSLSDDDRLKGSCCSAMVLHKYEEQIEGLKKYSNIDKIPTDPYDIQAKLAKELLDFDKNIVLTPIEQQIYDNAMKMSNEGGPCCCMCWRWYVYEGLAKYLIRYENFNAQQVAEVWNLSDGCGGG